MSVRRLFVIGSTTLVIVLIIMFWLNPSISAIEQPQTTSPPVCSVEELQTVLDRLFEASGQLATAGQAVPRPRTSEDYARLALAYEAAVGTYYDDINPQMPACIDGLLMGNAMGDLLDAALFGVLESAVARYERDTGDPNMAEVLDEHAAQSVALSLERRDALDSDISRILEYRPLTGLYWSRDCTVNEWQQYTRALDKLKAYWDEELVPLVNETFGTSLELNIVLGVRDMIDMVDALEIPDCAELQEVEREAQQHYTDAYVTVMFARLGQYAPLQANSDLAAAVQNVFDARRNTLEN